MKSCIVLSFVVILSFFVFASSAHSENALPQAELLSYDYSPKTNFGIGYQTNAELERSDTKNNQWHEENRVLCTQGG